MGKEMSIRPETIGALFEMSRDPVVGVDGCGQVVFANPAAVSLLGARAGDSAGDTVPEHVLSDPAGEFITTAQVGAAPANIYVKRLEGLLVCSFSLLRREPSDARQERLLQEMSSCLMNARMAMDALVRHTNAEADPVTAETSAILYQNFFRLQRLSRHMTYAAGAIHGELAYSPHVVELGALCRELCDTVARLTEDTGIAVLFQADFGMHLTMADSTLVETMLANLLTNSLSHCKAGDTVQVELTRQGERFIIAVRDTGSGIPPERLSALFNGAIPTDSTDPTLGSGLGLLIARGIAERHGGAVILESRPGQGTSVRVSLPYRQCDEMKARCPQVQYRSDGMDVVLTELSVILDRKYYNKKLFD